MLFRLLLVFMVVWGCVTLTPITGGPIREDAHWPRKKFPISVMLVGLSPCRAEKMRMAAATWNKELIKAGAPEPAFVVREAPAISKNLPGHIWVVEAPLPSPPAILHDLGNCQMGYYAGTDKVWGALITMGTNYCNLRASRHELGHALGLQHAPEVCEGCVMNSHVPWFENHLVEHGWLRQKELQYVVNQMRR